MTTRAASTASTAGASRLWSRLGTRLLPFADAATPDLPLPRLLRLSLFQVSVGLALVLLNATLNRVMIVELGLPATVVAVLIALPLLFAPLRALIGHKSDNHRSILGWRRVPYLWAGTMLGFAGLAILPFALLVMTGRGTTADGVMLGQIFGALAFLMVGAGVAITQTAGLALATDLAPADARPRVVSLLYVMLLIGMLLSSLVLGRVLQGFTETELVQVIQGTALVTLILNTIALWKQEPRRAAADVPAVTADFNGRWADFTASPRTRRLLVAVGLGAIGFGMQDVLLEPYGGQVLALSVAATTSLTALSSLGTLIGLALAARALARGVDAAWLAGMGALAGIGAFALVVLSAPLGSVSLFCGGAMLIGFGGGLFAVATLTAAMALGEAGAGLALGAWGAVQASAAGLGMLVAGIIRDWLGGLALAGHFGEALMTPATGYSIVWHLEILALFASLIALGPLARRTQAPSPRAFGLPEFPT